MKIYITTIFIFFLSFALKAEKMIDITPLKLPYDSLTIKEIYAYNSTILVRSANTIYKSTDDGLNWKIAFESSKKINQFYSSDPHTIFIVGDSGLVYRTFDYGESWIDLSYKNDQSFTGIAAKDFDNYLIISSNRAFINDVNSLNGKLIPLDFVSDIPLYQIIYSVDKYYFYGTKRKEYFTDYYGMSRVNLFLTYNIYDGEKVNSTNSLYIKGVTDDYPYVETDSLRLFPSKYGIYHSAVNSKIGGSGINLNDGVQDIFFYDNNQIFFGKDNIISVDENMEKTNLFSREGLWVRITTDSLIHFEYKDGFKDSRKLEHQDLNIKPINSVFKTDSNSYYISSNNSTIYKAVFTDVKSNVKNYNEKTPLIFGNMLLLKDNIKLISIYDYMGISVDYQKIDDYTYKLPRGLNFITYLVDGRTKTIKLLVVR